MPRNRRTYGASPPYARYPSTVATTARAVITPAGVRQNGHNPRSSAARRYTKYVWAQRARSLFKALEAGARRATTSQAVVVEVVHVLTSKALYATPRRDVRVHLGNLIALPGLKLARKRLYRDALDIFVAYPHLDFVDALTVAEIKGKTQAAVLSFDRDFDRIPGVRRTEP